MLRSATPNLDICERSVNLVLRISLNGTATGRTSARAWSAMAARRTAPDSPAWDGLQRDLDQLQRHTNFGPVGALHAIAGMTRRATTRNGVPVDPSLLAPLPRH